MTALGAAVSIALLGGALLTLLHVYADSAGEAAAARLLDERRRQARALGAERVDAQALRGRRPAEAIIGAARRGRYDLIVLASAADSALRHPLLGSVTEQVVRHSPCPALVVPLPPGPADRSDSQGP